MPREELEALARRLGDACQATSAALYEFQTRHLDRACSVEADVLRFALRIESAVEAGYGRAPSRHGDSDTGVLNSFLKAR